MVYLLGLVSLSFLHLLLLFLSSSCFYFSMLMLLFFLVTPYSFSLPVLSLFPFWARAVVFSTASTPCWSCGSLPAPRLVSRRCSVSPGSAPMRVCRYNVLLGVLLARIPVLTSTASPRWSHRGTLHLPVIDLAPRGEDGMVASVEETESSASSTSSDRPSAVLPIVSPPRGLLAWVS